MKPKPLSVDLLRIDGETQARVSISEDTVDEYAELIGDSKDWPFDPLDVFHDGSDYFVADGFHRTLASHRVGRASIPCRIHKGTAKDARIFGMTANDRHGLRMNRADKRACVEWLLENVEELTQLEIARTAGVSRRLVQQICADHKAQNAPCVPAKPEPEKAHYAPLDDEDPEPDEAQNAPSEDDKPEPEKAQNAPSFKTEQAKAVKTGEAFLRCFDVLNDSVAHVEFEGAIETTQELIGLVRRWDK